MRRVSERSSKPMGRKQMFGCLSLISLALLFFAGCAADNAFKEGSALLERGNYDKAIIKLTEAVELSEKDAVQGTMDDLGKTMDGLGKTFDDTAGGLLDGLFGKKDKQAKQKTEDEQITHAKKTTASKKQKPPSKYQLKLLEAKQKGAEYHFEEANKDLAKTDLGLAKAHLDKAIEYNPSIDKFHELLKETTASIKDAEGMRRQAFELSSHDKWDDAVAVINKALGKYRSMPDGKQSLAQLRRGAYQYHVRLSEDFLGKDDRKQAQAEAEQALSYSLHGTEAKAVLEELRRRERADDLVLVAGKKMNAGECEQALKLLEQAHELYPSMSNLPELMINAKKAVCDKRIKNGNDCMQNGQYCKALRYFRNSKDLLADYKNINALIEDASCKLSDEHLARAKDYNNRNLYGNALLYDVLSLGYNPMNLEAKEQLTANKDEIKKQIKYVVGFVGFKSSAKNRELANTLEAMALQHLNRVKPPNVLIMDRVDLEDVMSEQNLNITDLVDPDFRIESGKLKGVDALIIGQILENKILTSRTSSYGKTRYQSGLKPESNPNYTTASRAVDQAARELKKAQDELSSAQGTYSLYNTLAAMGGQEMPGGRMMQNSNVSMKQQAVNNARNNLIAAQNRLASTPAQVMVPNILSHTYPIYHVTKTGKISCFIKMLDSMTGSIVFTDRIVGKYEESDRFVEGDGARNVTADPLDLPDDVSMADKAMERTIEKMNSSLELASKKHGNRFVDNMRKAETAEDVEKAAENCIKYLFAYPVGYDHTNKMLGYLEDVISDEKDMLVLDKLLQQHCHVLLERAEFPAILRERDEQVWITDLKTEVAEDIKFPCILIAIDGRPLGSIKEVEAIMTQYGVGDKMSIAVLSEEKNISAEIELAKAKY